MLSGKDGFYTFGEQTLPEAVLPIPPRTASEHLHGKTPLCSLESCVSDHSSYSIRTLFPGRHPYSSGYFYLSPQTAGYIEEKAPAIAGAFSGMRSERFPAPQFGHKVMWLTLCPVL